MIYHQNKQYFLILWQEEVEKMKTPAQLAVYSAIKSFTANGKQEIDLSFRDLQKRCSVSLGWLKTVIQELVDAGLVFTHGTVGRRGGDCQVFSVRTVEKSSVHSVASSVQSLSSKRIQSNKVIIEPQPLKGIESQPFDPLPYAEIWKIAWDLKLPLALVQSKHDTIMDKIKESSFKGKTVYFTLRNWLRGDIEKNYVRELDEMGMVDLQQHSPETLAKLEATTIAMKEKGKI